MRAPLLTAIVAAVLATSSIARADASPPEEMACLSGREGSDCGYNGHYGHCEAAKCGRLSYSHLDDAGRPTGESVDCFKCVEDSSGCGTVSGRSGAELGALAMAGSFSLLLLIKRRRNRLLK